MTGAAQRDARFRSMADRMLFGPNGYGIPASLTPNEGVVDPANDTRSETGVAIAVTASPSVPVTSTLLADTRVRADDAVTYVAASEVGRRPEPGWTFAFSGESAQQVIAVRTYRSGFEDAAHELVIRGRETSL